MTAFSKRLRYVFASLLLVFLVGISIDPNPASAQSRRYHELVERFQRPQVYHEAVVIPHDSGGHAGVTFRLPHDLLVFTQAPKRETRGAFMASVTAAVEVYRDGEQVGDKAWRQKHFVDNYESTESRSEDVQGSVWFELPPGKYQYRLEVTDRYAKQTGRLGKQTFTVPDTGKLQVEKALMAEKVEKQSDALVLQLSNLSGDLPFGEAGYAVVPLVVPENKSLKTLSLNYSLRRLPASDQVRSAARKRKEKIFRPTLAKAFGDEATKGGQVIQTGTVKGTDLIPIVKVKPAGNAKPTIRLQQGTPGQATTHYVSVINLQGEQLTNDAYALEVTVEDSSAVTAQTLFSSHWRTMPYSLYDLEVAIDHLSFIADEAAIDRLEEGSHKTMEERFEKFWVQKDPTPGTPFNPLMAEYYKRIDYAADTFRSGRSPAPNGLRTDRARVYIVNGPPASKERTVPRRGRVRETWTYPDGRVFTFEATSGFSTFQLVEGPEPGSD